MPNETRTLLGSSSTPPELTYLVTTVGSLVPLCRCISAPLSIETTLSNTNVPFTKLVPSLLTFAVNVVRTTTLPLGLVA